MNKRKIFRLLFNHKLLLTFALIFSLFSVICTLYIPIVIGDIIDNITILSFKELLINYFILLIALTIFLIIMSYISIYLMNLISYKIAYNLRKDIAKKLLNIELSTLTKYSEGDIIMRAIYDVEQISDTVTLSLTNLINGILTIVATLIIMLFINYKIALLVFVLTPLSLLFSSMLSKKLYKTTKEQAKLRADLSSKVSESFNIHDEIILANKANDSYLEYEKINNELLKVGFISQFLGALVNPLTRFINALIYAAIVLYGSYNVLGGFITVGSLQIFLSYAQGYTKPFNDVSQVISELQQLIVSCNRVFEIIDLKLINHEGKIELKEINKIEFKNVSFKYEGSDKLILNNIDLVINKGEKVAIVGSTGSGKTTLVKLLLGFYEITSGTIYINDIELNSYSRTSLRENISLVLQDTFVFKDSIINNLNYSGDLEKEEVIKNAIKTKADTFITKLENKYETVVSNDSLSYGQSQLIAITRVLNRNNDMIILDEATSNLDLLSERLIEEAFKVLSKDKTMLIIAHRLQTILDSNKIIVLDKGNIVACDKHINLINTSEVYQKIYNSQFN